MKFKALLAATCLGGALLAGAPAMAQHGGDGRGEIGYAARDWRGDRDWRGGPGRLRPALTVVTHRGALSLRRDDRLFWIFASAPYYFRPGFTYDYTDRCNRRGCLVNVYRGHSYRLVDRIFAPHPPRLRRDFDGFRRDDWRGDGWSGEGEYRRDRRDDMRDRDGRDLDEAPRRWERAS